MLIFLSSLKVLYNNIKYYNQERKGVIINVDYKNNDGDNIRGTYQNAIKQNLFYDTVYGGTKILLKIGDSVKYRYSGEKGGNVIFKVNGNSIGCKYGIWDVLSPFIVLIGIYISYKIIKSIFKL